MSITFTKLFSSITESTIWCESSEIRIVWITMLAMSDKEGRIWGSIPGLANRAQVSIQSVESALEKFQAPDNYSRTTDHEGRRIEPIDGGWRLLNHGKYRAIRDSEERKAYKREWIKDKRKKDKDVDNVDPSRPQYTHTEADTEADPLKSKDLLSSPKIPPTPYSEIVELYHEKLSTLPRVAKLTDVRKRQIRKLWSDESLPDIEEWTNFFEYISKSDFLMGKGQARGDQSPFMANLEWITRQANYVKILEGNYHG